VKVRQDLGGGTVRDAARYEYNGLHWRTVQRLDTNADGTLDQQRTAYYSAAGQVIDEL
jgi:hypothetical protein